ncbi:LAO/AO transport system kinase [Pedobacter sp. UYP30]|uniref:methylmalonyl Co-A mutase-associated GTPase MeaB n=1 Tax=Pedobacter sp. UYP30 TaxID=1756400 RepID=UPI00339852B5
MEEPENLLSLTKNGDFRALARLLTLVENDISPAGEILKSLQSNNAIPVIGITGPPGAGKSTLVNAIATELSKADKRLAILAIDPTSPFNFGSLLGDRIRMASQFTNPNVFIRSLATRGSLGGISAKTIEMVDVLKASNFDMIIVETVGVGQSEVEIAGLADKTIVLLVPESGDGIQNIKSGLMEIADCFVVNKADRAGADEFANNLKKTIHGGTKTIPVLKTVADKGAGVPELCKWMLSDITTKQNRRYFLLAEKAWRLIQQQRMVDVDRVGLLSRLKIEAADDDFNIYRFADRYRLE